LLKKSSVTLDGKNVVIIGRSNIVGKPLAALLLLENATVTICHTHTKNLASICAKADILVVAIGVANFINAKYTNSHQVIVDVGSNYDKNHKSCGDVDFTAVNNKIAAISKVPGGVGPMTICMLINNLINLTYAQHKLSHKLIY
jgi:methylenetetrahydrofolate dehydrogenase (NADP+)/methenyltetrahydrofolate cyclohydrolase